MKHAKKHTIHITFKGIVFTFSSYKSIPSQSKSLDPSIQLLFSNFLQDISGHLVFGKRPALYILVTRVHHCSGPVIKSCCLFRGNASSHTVTCRAEKQTVDRVKGANCLFCQRPCNGFQKKIIRSQLNRNTIFTELLHQCIKPPCSLLQTLM